MTEQHFNNGQVLLTNRNRISGIIAQLQELGNISVIEPLKASDNIALYVKIKSFALEVLAEEETRLQNLFDDLKEPQIIVPPEPQNN